MTQTRITLAGAAVLVLFAGWMFRYDIHMRDDRIYKIDRWTGATVICLSNGQCKRFPENFIN